jgi:hypothetical protein
MLLKLNFRKFSFVFALFGASILNAQTEGDTVKMEGLEIKTYKKSKTESSMVKEIRGASLTVSGVTSELIKSIQVSSANDVVKRVPGVTILGDKFLVVRGISPRYNVTMLNGFSAPSFNPDSKVFSFDILPASVIDNIKLYKTASAELPADFAGGLIKLETISMPDNSGWTVNAGIGFDGITTSKPFLSQIQKSDKMMGLNYAANDMPELLKNRHLDADPAFTLKERIDVTNGLNNNFYPETINAPLNYNLSLEKRFRYKAKNYVFGSTHFLSYRDNYNHNVARRSSVITIPELRRILNFSDATYNNQKIFTFLNNFTMSFKNGLRLDLKNLFVNDANYSVFQRNGSALPGAYGENGLYQYNSFIQYSSANTFRNFWNSSLIYYYNINKKLQVDGNFGFTNSNYFDQDRKSTLQIRNDDPTGVASTPNFITSYAATMDQLRFGRWYYTLPEQTNQASINFKYELSENSTLQYGYYYEGIQRKFDLRCLGMVSKVWDGDSTTPSRSGVLLDEFTWPYNSYTAKSIKNAGFISYKGSFKNHNLNVGVRFESFTFDIKSAGFAPAIGKDRLVLNTANFFPSLNYTYKTNEFSQFRLAAGLTCNRPEFRELSPLAYLDIENWLTANGNASVKPISLIYNGDARYEFYKGKTMFHFGLFWKNTQNPVITKMTDAIRYKFTNAAYAINYGAEFELRFESNSFIKNVRSPLRNLEFLFNGTYSLSNVWDYKDSVNIVSLNQSMVGQSPYTVNAMVFYKMPQYGLKFGISYFKQGDRVIFIGDNSSLFSLVEKVAANLDITAEKSFGKKFTVRMRLINLLNNENIIYQDLNNNGKLEYYKGYSNDISADNIFRANRNIFGGSFTATMNF